MRVSVALLLLGLAGCGSGTADDDDDDIASADGDADADADGDSDGDADGDADGDLPECEPGPRASVWVGTRRVLESAAEMVVVRSDREGLDVEEGLFCDTRGEKSIELHVDGLLEEAWLPPVGSQVQGDVLLMEMGVNYLAYASIRTREGTLIFEGGDSDRYLSDAPRFQIIEVSDPPRCKVNDCWSYATLRASVQTDDGPVELAVGESTIVTVEGAPFLAVLTSALDHHIRETEECGCDDCSGGPRVSGYIARTTAIDMQMDPAEPPSDDCPAGIPVAGDPCTTTADVTCPYVDGAGCMDSFQCVGCRWSLREQFEPEGVDCGVDPGSCLGEGCSEEDVCSDCACPDPIGERWRCVSPGAECPPC